MEALINALNNLKKIDLNDVMAIVYEEADFQKLIGYLNTEQQLYLGIDSLGNSLGEYAPSTIAIKKRKGQPTDRVTLKDTGDFYKDFDIIVDEEGFIITNVNEKTLSLTDRYGNDIFGITDENFEAVIKYVNGRLKDIITESILKDL
jgi:hypothetical protein